MIKSNEQEGFKMQGQELFDVLVENTGLPPEYVRRKLDTLLKTTGTPIESLSLEQVRDLLSNLLLDLIKESIQEPA
jgi:hypothetical protein